MHKRKKGEYGVLYIAEKKRLITAAYLCIALFFILFNVIYFTKKTDAASLTRTSLKSETVFNAAAGYINYYGGNYGSAVKYFKREPSSYFQKPYLNYITALLYFKQSKYKKALKYIDTALKLLYKSNGSGKLSSANINYLILKAKIEAGGDNMKGAVTILKSILNKNPYSLKTLLFIANIYIYENNLKTAVFYLNAAKMQHPGNIDSYYLLSKIYSVLNEKNNAEKNLISLIGIDPYFKKAYFRLAALYILDGKIKKAAGIFDKYLKIDPYSKTALYQSAILEYTQKEYSKARKRFLDFIDVSADKKNNFRLKNNAYFFIGISYILEKKYKKGLSFLGMLKPGRHYIDAKLETMEIYISRYKKTNKTKYKKYIISTISKMLNDIKIKKNLKFYYFSAIALSEMKDYNLAELVIKKGLFKFKNNTALLYELGSVYHYLKADRKAAAVMKKILKINPYDASALNYLGYYLAVKNKDIKTAEKLIKKALSYDKGSPFIIDSLGFVYYREGKYDKALKLFKTALKRLGKSPTVLKHTGMDYLKLKNYKKAIEYFNKSYKMKKTTQVKKYIDELKKIH
ncbi:MAG: tetratricopeptide repeat protein [Deltaproteobacteria bacterium]|jgi:tetratricopeptide (TPR) repeat protein|uniref:Tetratricopeptide repeat protein n=1 Tax=Candidatus Acidulodesulfobacterium acidiphilum TaxID=2597224 RepID=A0A520XFQ2_9DELT|nr:tetratricopeptide repeat protein [Deltaproteobacteria bacterium]MCL6119912.1 tetratricopeptide repeat protein [Deltaproteobacteria bacterium]MDA8298400.1 tetratricopeptide repeat protein [Deltaproteobacteria bacterium]RZV39999.1 MAG: tetratricopeptide repeat protein [Candidatus Acidulodesulfobacterium acidiphilum]